MNTRLSESMKRLWADPEARARRCAALRRAWANPEALARLSVAHKRAGGLGHLSPAQRADYNVLRYKGRYDRATALAMVGARPAP